MKKSLAAAIAALGLAVCVSGAPATVERGTGVYNYDWVGYVDAFGENVHVVTSAPYKYQVVLMPNGEYVYTEQWDKFGVIGIVEGLDTGTIWIRTDNVSPYVERSTGGGMEHYTFMGTYVGDNGQTLRGIERMHVSYDANGNLRVDNWEFFFRDIGKPQ